MSLSYAGAVFQLAGATPTMQWINEPDDRDPNLVHQALVLDAHEPLAPALVAFWSRILADGCANAGTNWMSLAIDIAERQIEDDTHGWMHAAFLNAQNRACAGVGHYYLRGDAFDLLQGDDESNDAFNRRQIRWYLDQYEALKDAAHGADVQAFFRQIEAVRPLPVRAATANGWFDLQVGEYAFGPLPAEDQAMLAGEEPVPADPLVALAGGQENLDLLQELGAALIE